MHCLTCGYNLHGLPENRCPECGQKFDPDDPRIFASEERSTRGIRFYLPLAFAIYPLVPLAMIWATWVAAAISLGHAPVPYADDPKQLNAVVRALHVVTLIAFAGLLPAAVAPVLILVYWVFGRGKHRGLASLNMAIVFIALLAALILCLGSEIGRWFTD